MPVKDTRLMNPIEKARYYNDLLKKDKITQQTLAEQLGVHQSTIANEIRLLELPDEIQDMIAGGTLSPTHGRYLLHFNGNKEKQVLLADKTVKLKLTIKDLLKEAFTDEYPPATDGATGFEKADIKLINPIQAAKWLRENNIDNRKLDMKWVKYLAKEITEGRWRITNQGIGFSRDERLLDGQHRLAAIMEAGFSVNMLVFTGMTDDSFSALDANKVRGMEVRTGIPKYFTEIYNFMLVLTFGNARTSPGDVAILHEHFKLTVEELKQHCDATTRFYTSVPIRTAAVISLEQGINKQYVLDSYRTLALLDFPSLNQVSGAFVKWHTTETKNRNASLNDRIDNMLRAMFIFKPENSDRTQIHIKDINKELFLSAVRNTIEKVLHN